MHFGFGWIVFWAVTLTQAKRMCRSGLRRSKVRCLFGNGIIMDSRPMDVALAGISREADA
jgi:hypothetical protein